MKQSTLGNATKVHVPYKHLTTCLMTYDSLNTLSNALALLLNNIGESFTIQRLKSYFLNYSVCETPLNASTPLHTTLSVLWSLTNSTLKARLKKMKLSVRLIGGEGPSRVGPTISSLVPNPNG